MSILSQPGLPDPAGRLVELSYGLTHYNLRIPPATARRSFNATAAADATEHGGDETQEPTSSHAAAVPPPLIVCVHGSATYSYVFDDLATRCALWKRSYALSAVLNYAPWLIAV